MDKRKVPGRLAFGDHRSRLYRASAAGLRLADAYFLFQIFLTNMPPAGLRSNSGGRLLTTTSQHATLKKGVFYIKVGYY